MSFIYYVKRTVTEKDWDYEAYTNFVVFANSEEEARRTHPEEVIFLSEDGNRWLEKDGDSIVETGSYGWVDAKHIHTLEVEDLRDVDKSSKVICRGRD